jgi:hypothetical protein
MMSFMIEQAARAHLDDPRAHGKRVPALRSPRLHGVCRIDLDPLCQSTLLLGAALQAALRGKLPDMLDKIDHMSTPARHADADVTRAPLPASLGQRGLCLRGVM